ncbi:MAG: NAD-dependent epimerase/dehydratase family protein [Halioglobus sp.]|nr:NAD-dependent epimerase/dehydratase family protein [Halioglobus sp.]
MPEALAKKIEKVCVTGGAGFIGSRVVRGLLERDIQVLVIDNLSVGRRENVPAPAVLLEADILDPSIATDLAGCDAVIHLAARVAIRSSFEFVVEDTSTNVVGTANILRSASSKASRVKKFVFASSMAVYADSVATIPARRGIHATAGVSLWRVQTCFGDAGTANVRGTRN